MIDVLPARCQRNRGFGSGLAVDQHHPRGPVARACLAQAHQFCQRVKLLLCHAAVIQRASMANSSQTIFYKSMLHALINIV
nr:MAG TPA: hypothetical protein [Caudoviricetes sp.]